VLAAVPLSAQSGNPYRVRAYRTDEEMTLDGHLTEAAWSSAQAGTGFTQREPDEFEPATERTDFFVVYTPQTLYLGVYAHDSEPDGLVAKEMERDSPLYPDDSVAFVLDTFGDSRNAYAFETNPNGARFDALVTDEGRDINVEWDGVWNVSARRAPDGWVAEIAIPFSTLRFDRSLETWGINVRRMIRRKNEEVNWTPLGRDVGSYRDLERYALYRISLAGKLEGMEGLKPSRQVNIKPFVVGELSKTPGAADESTQDDTEVGLDVKWGVTRNLSLDLTYNTDFAEVEVDQQQVNLTRFSLFFPEKREFFLENAGIFEFGPPQADSFTPPQMKAFFSRRIGLDAGRQVPIDYGVRMTGRIGGWNVGVMDVMTADETFDDGSMVPEANFGVVRMKRNLGERSGVGFIYTDREDEDLSSNQVFGVDFDYKPTRAADLQAFYSKSSDDREPGEDWSAGTTFRYRRGDFDGGLELLRVSEGYRPDMGFLLRRDFERIRPKATWRPRIERWGIRTYFLEGDLDYYERASTGELESRTFSLAFAGASTYAGDGFGAYRVFETERIFEPFEIQPGIVIEPGTYSFESWRVGGRTNASRVVSFSGRVTSGDFYDGERDWANVRMRVRANKYFSLETSIDYNDVSLKAGDFITKVVGQRFSLSFTPDLRLAAFVQYDDSADLVAANVRFNWIYRPGADLFVVYNESWDAPSFSARETSERQLIVKFTYLFRS
jgi:hypothetical protein